MSDIHDLLNRRLDDFEWSVRTLNCLWNGDITTIRQLVSSTEREVSLLPNLGAKSVREIKEFLADRGLRLGMDISPQRLERIPYVTRDGGSRPMCVGKVHLSRKMTITRMIREEEAKKRGRPVDECGAPAMWRVDRQPLCPVHAGRRALEILSEREI